MRDRKLRLISLWIASVAGALALLAFAMPLLDPLIVPSAMFVAGLNILLFMRMLFSKFYRSGIDKVNLVMQGDDPWPGKPWRFSDPEWGLFGRRVGDPPLLLMRAVLVLGALPAYVVQDLTGKPAGWLWFIAACVALELSIMHAAIDAHSRAPDFRLPPTSGHF